MTFKYYLSGTDFSSSGCQIINSFQAQVNQLFDAAPDAYSVQEETVFESGSYVDVEARINRGINSYTGAKLGDDFKLIVFKDLAHASTLGMKYFFNDNYWITYNTEIVKNFAASCMVRRCNNTLRWVDIDGNYWSEPCSIEYDFGGYDDKVTKANPVTPGKSLTIYCQLNSKTKKIHAGQRFLFGNDNEWSAYYVLGNAVRNFLNQQTLDNESGQILYLELGSHSVSNDMDDLVLGIADKYKNEYSLSVLPTTISGSVGSSTQIYSTLTLHGDIISKPISYLSSASPIATVSGSGLVNFISNGSCNISAYMTNNTSASAIISVAISASAVSAYEIRITPNIGYILESDTTTYTIYGYVNGIVQSDIFNFNLVNANVPINHYVKTDINGNSFSIKNIEKYLDFPLLINCVSGINTKQISIELRGGF
jgi:hypothetical protein